MFLVSKGIVISTKKNLFVFKVSQLRKICYFN